MFNNLVTVCITTYNRKELLELSLISVLGQTYTNIEIIIVDDYSNDGTYELVNQKLLKVDNRVKYIRHDKNKGLAAARNSAINIARGKYFSFCDDDDLWLPNFIEEFVSVASKFGDNWCFCCSEINTKFFKKNIEINFEFEGELKNLIKNGFTPPVSAQFYNLSSLKKIKGYNANIKSGVDHDLWIRLAKIEVKIKYIPKALSLPNKNDNKLRMTNSYEKRLNGINDSLLIWKKDLIDMYGNEYYLQFCKAYILREEVKFFIKYFREFRIVMIIKIIKRTSLIGLAIQLSILLKNKLINYIFIKVIKSNKKTLKILPTLRIKD